MKQVRIGRAVAVPDDRIDPTEELSEDAFLGGRLSVLQPVRGYRAAMDPVLLAAAVPAARCRLALDVGCGVGTAALCFSDRVPDCHVVGLERDPAVVEIARRNVTRNDRADRVEILEGDILDPPAFDGKFDQVFANPPFMEAKSAARSPVDGRNDANIEGEARLSDWVRFMLRVVKNKGGVTLIHRADRIHDILKQFDGRAGEIVVFPLWPGPGKPAKRVIVQARKGVQGGTIMAPGLMLHGKEQRYTPAAERVLRDGAALQIRP